MACSDVGSFGMVSFFFLGNNPKVRIFCLIFNLNTMKRKLLNEIDFRAIEPLDNKQLVEIDGGGILERLQEIFDEMINGMTGCNGLNCSGCTINTLCHP